jgi:hypothetical protein
VASKRELTVVLLLVAYTYACCVHSPLCQQQQQPPVGAVNANVAADAAEDHIMTSNDVQYLQQYMHAAGFLLEFCDWLHTAKATTATGVTLLKRIMAGLVTWQRHIAQHNDHYGKAPVVQRVKTELLALMTAQSIRFDDATVEQSQRIIQEWRTSVTAGSNRARQRLQQVRRLFCSYLHFCVYLHLAPGSTCTLPFCHACALCSAPCLLNCVGL